VVSSITTVEFSKVIRTLIVVVDPLCENYLDVVSLILNDFDTAMDITSATIVKTVRFGLIVYLN